MPVGPLDDPGDWRGQPRPATSTWKPWGDDRRFKTHSNNLRLNHRILSSILAVKIAKQHGNLRSPILRKPRQRPQSSKPLPSQESHGSAHCFLHCSTLSMFFSKTVLSHSMSKLMSLCITLWVLDANHVPGTPASKLSCWPTAWTKTKRKGA